MSHPNKGMLNVLALGGLVILRFEAPGEQFGHELKLAPAPAIELATNLMRAAHALIIGKPFAGEKEDEL